MFVHCSERFLTVQQQKQVIFACVEVLPLLARNAHFGERMGDNRFLAAYKQMLAEESGVNLYCCLIKVVPHVIRLFPDEEDYIVGIVEKKAGAPEEAMRLTVLKIFPLLLGTVRNKRPLLNVFDRLVNDTSMQIKSEMKRSICDVLMIDTERYKGLFNTLVVEGNFRVKYMIAKQLSLIRGSDIYESTLEHLVMSRFFGVREEALKELDYHISTVASSGAQLNESIERYHNYSNGDSVERQGFVERAGCN